MTDGTRPASCLRRFAERTFDGDTYARVLVPALDDVEHECSLATGTRLQRWRMCARAHWGLAKAMTLCGIGDVAHNRDGVASSVAIRAALTLPIVLAALMLPNVSWLIEFGSSYGAWTALTAGVLLVPSNLLTALPVAFFVALATFRPRADVATSRLGPTALAGSLGCVAAVFLMLMVIVPTSNQAYREHVFGAYRDTMPNAPLEPLRKGLAEMRLSELNAHIHQPPSSRQGALARAHRQERFAFLGTVLVLGLLGLGLPGRWKSKALTFAVAVGVLFSFGLAYDFGSRFDRFGYPTALGLWTANGVFLLVALRLLRTRPDAAPTDMKGMTGAIR